MVISFLMLIEVSKLNRALEMAEKETQQRRVWCREGSPIGKTPEIANAFPLGGKIPNIQGENGNKARLYPSNM